VGEKDEEKNDVKEIKVDIKNEEENKSINSYYSNKDFEEDLKEGNIDELKDLMKMMTKKLKMNNKITIL